jgi:flavin-binding protein dodecin
MAVQKAVDLIGTGNTVEDAIAEAVDRAGLTLSGIGSFEVRKLTGSLDGARITYRVRVRVWFTLLERMHG